MRALLTALGIMIGVMNVVAMVSLISGVNASVMDVFRQMGTNTFTVTKMPVGNVDYSQYLEYLRRPDFTYRDAEAIEKLCPVGRSPSRRRRIVAKKIKYGGESTREIYIVGVTPEFQYVSDSDVGDGRFFAWPESDRKKQVAVLGHPIKEHLFPGPTPSASTS